MPSNYEILQIFRELEQRFPNITFDQVKENCYQETIKHLRFLKQLKEDGKNITINSNDKERLKIKEYDEKDFI